MHLDLYRIGLALGWIWIGWAWVGLGFVLDLIGFGLGLALHLHLHVDWICNVFGIRMCFGLGWVGLLDWIWMDDIW